MKARRNKKTNTLLALYDNILLRTKVDLALDDKVPYAKIIDICKEYKLDISASSLSRYKTLRADALKTGDDLRKTLNGKVRKRIKNIRRKEVVPKSLHEQLEYLNKDKPTSADKLKTAGLQTAGKANVHYTNYVDVLDEVVRHGLTSIRNEEVPVKTQDLIKAVDTIAKLTNNANEGLSVEGLQQVRLFQAAVESALVSVLTKYIPADKQKQALADMHDAEKQKYMELNNSAQGRQLLESMKQGGIV